MKEYELMQFAAPRGLTPFLHAWPTDKPLLALLGRGPYQVLALDSEEISSAEALAMPLAGRTGAAARSYFATGILGILSYDEAAFRHGGCIHQQDALAPARFFRVKTSLVWERATGVARLEGGATRSPESSAHEHARAHAISLRAQASELQYLESVQSALQDIRAGRYYQINLLRYFNLVREPDFSWLFNRLAQVGGPYACLVRVPGLSLVSFSPERFVSAKLAEGEVYLNAEPIKGTAARGAGVDSDRAAAAALLSSKKDLAELHMIVDLMRNDLQVISQAGSVQVPIATKIDTHPHVHHLSARITSMARPGLCLGEMLQALCPGGSITGAPKREVMQAIREYEGRPRGYFMGNVFYLDDSGRFDSSILIRTLVRYGQENWEYAAGSGIVIGSDPQLELREIEAKCGVITA